MYKLKNIIKRILFFGSLLVFGLLLLFQIPSIQQTLANEFSKWLESEFSISLSSTKIKVGLLSGLVWEDILLLDSKADTLVFVEELKMTTTDLAFNHFNKIYTLVIVSGGGLR